MTKHSLPSWSEAYSGIIDEAIEQLLQKARIRSSIDIFMPLIKSATKRGRKLRSSLALRYLDWETVSEPISKSQEKKTFSKEGESYKELLEGLSAVELLHSASCIIDDIIDGDTQRRNIPSFHVREGVPEAQLVALEMILLQSYLGNHKIKREIIDASRLMLQGEACDSFPFDKFTKLVDSKLADSDSLWDYEHLLSCYVLKTSPSFAVSHKIIGIAYELSESEINALEKYGHSLGVFYQYANDYHDTFSISPDVRGDSSDEARVTLSMPLIIALSKEDNFYSEMIGKTLPRANISGLVQKMRDDGIEEKAREMLEESKQNVLQNYPNLKKKENNPLNCPSELRVLVDIIGKSDFWSYSYNPS